MTAKRRGVSGFQGDALRALRMERQLTEGELAAAAGLTAALVVEYEEGGRIPEWRTLVTLADALSCDTAALVPEKPTTLQDLRNAAGFRQQDSAAAAGLGRSGYAMLENGQVRALRPEVAQRLADAWKVSAEHVVQAHAAGVQASAPRPIILSGAVLEGLADHFDMTPEALLELARNFNDQRGRRRS